MVFQLLMRTNKEIFVTLKEKIQEYGKNPHKRTGDLGTLGLKFGQQSALYIRVNEVSLTNEKCSFIKMGAS